MVLRHAHCLRSVRGNTHAMKDLFSAKARTLPGTSGQTRLRMPPDRWMPGPVSDPQYAPVDAQNRFPPQGIRRSSLKRRCPVSFRRSSRPQLPRKSEAIRRCAAAHGSAMPLPGAVWINRQETRSSLALRLLLNVYFSHRIGL